MTKNYWSQNIIKKKIPLLEKEFNDIELKLGEIKLPSNNKNLET